TFIGGPGNDTFIAKRGDGLDTIDDTATAGEGNILQFPDISNPDDPDVTFSLSPGPGYLRVQYGRVIDNRVGELRLMNFDPDDVFGPHAVDTYEFSDGTVLTYHQLIDRGFDLFGTAGNDTLIGTNAPDRIFGGPGNDQLSGGRGNDSYVFNLGD